MATTPPKELIKSLKTLVSEAAAAIAGTEITQPDPASAFPATEESEENKSYVRGYNGECFLAPATDLNSDCLQMYSRIS
jgi:hypothetical protein